MNIKRVLIQAALLILVFFLVYQVYQSIMEPVRFKNVIQDREDVIKVRMGEIKVLQVEYKKINNRYSGCFDTLIQFYNKGEMPMVMKHGTAPDSLTEEQALEQGLITRDTTYIVIKDTLFKDIPNFDINKISHIPFTQNKKFEIEAGTVVRANFQIPVFQVRCMMTDYLWNIKQQDLLENEIRIMKEEENFPGLFLGSMDEPSTDGNW